jgi:uncharacterized membrane protein YwzB
MILLLKLLLAHLLGDFFLQPTAWVESKAEKKIKSPAFYFHLLIHAGLLALLLWDVNYWGVILGLTLSHGLIDLLKLYRQNKKTKERWFVIDQVLHLISILVIWWIWEKPHLEIESLLQNPNVLILTLTVLFLTQPAGILLANVLKKWAVDIQQDSNQSLANAGKYIGILERLFVFAFILTNHWEAVGFLIAAKSVFRFGDLRKSKERKLTEYILIGTLMSFGIAMGIGLLASYLLKF